MNKLIKNTQKKVHNIMRNIMIVYKLLLLSTTCHVHNKQNNTKSLVLQASKFNFCLRKSNKLA